MATPTVHHGAMFDTNELVINMGPQHPSTHGVLRVVLRLDGEKVVDADVVIGYLHRGIEKLCEHRDWAQIVLITDRMDYVAAASNNLVFRIPTPVFGGGLIESIQEADIIANLVLSCIS